ncbi:MAG: 4-phosphoerythronate dehydrogenase PdxB [Pseudomonadales bacterium]|nr:4-phosphoerythronate dehydrogenase PdxB [Pseudomonadales bacterium]
MKLVVDENIPLAEAFFADLGDLTLLPGRTMTAADVKDADALLVRSVTAVNANLLQGSSVKFVGSATIGADHLETAYLDQHKITCATAPGCNAVAVVEYVAAALLELAALRGESFADRSIGIVGLGNVGSRLKKVMADWGLTVLACDPPLQEKGEPDLVSLEEALQADVVSIHTPLTRSGDHPTYHLFDAKLLDTLKQGAVLINASRGAVINNNDLKAFLERRSDVSVVLDVWEGEPFIDAELAQRVEIATPHIAGYSYDGKVKGTAMIYKALCDAMGLKTKNTLEDLMPDSASLTIDLSEGVVIKSCRDLVQRVYRIGEDDHNLRTSLQHPKDHRIAAFDQLRKHYRVRREFSQVSLRGAEQLKNELPAAELEKIQALGFRLPRA